MATFKVKYKTKPYFQYINLKKYQDDDVFSDVLNYIINPLKTPNHYIGSVNINDVSHAAEEMSAVIRHFGKDKGVHLRHMILSFWLEEKVSAHQAYFLAHEIAAYYGNEYQLVFAVHEDHAAPHIHFIMNTTSFVTGLKYRGRRDDYYRFQAHIKKVLWDYAGITTLMVVKDE